MDLNIDDYELIPINNVARVSSLTKETLYDVTVEGDHTIFINLPKSETAILAHNCDGDRIASQLLGWFKRFAPNLFTEHRICRLVTPIIITKNKQEKINNCFYSVAEFKSWETKNPNSTDKIIYLKGLGSWEKDDLISLVKEKGLETLVQTFVLDENGNALIEDWLGDDAEPRKQYLREFTLDINNI